LVAPLSTRQQVEAGTADNTNFDAIHEAGTISRGGAAGKTGWRFDQELMLLDPKLLN